MSHEHKQTFTETVTIEDHDKRETSKEFKQNRNKLIKQYHKGCFICDIKEDLECHHMLEWSLWKGIDPNKALKILKIFDIYGFSEQMKYIPLESPDDIRNLVMLCKYHHRDKNNGVHCTTFPTWLAQACMKDGYDLTPDNQETKS